MRSRGKNYYYLKEIKRYLNLSLVKLKINSCDLYFCNIPSIRILHQKLKLLSSFLIKYVYRYQSFQLQHMYR